MLAKAFEFSHAEVSTLLGDQRRGTWEAHLHWLWGTRRTDSTLRSVASNVLECEGRGTLIYGLEISRIGPSPLRYRMNVDVEVISGKYFYEFYP